jgi:hypothetical protein
MDRSSHVTLGGFLAGVVTAFPAGVLFQIVRRAIKDHAALRLATDGAGRTKWRVSREAAILGFFLLVVAALALGGVAAGHG